MRDDGLSDNVQFEKSHETKFSVVLSNTVKMKYILR